MTISTFFSNLARWNFLKSLQNVTDVKNVLLQVKLVELFNIFLVSIYPHPVLTRRVPPSSPNRGEGIPSLSERIGIPPTRKHGNIGVPLCQEGWRYLPVRMGVPPAPPSQEGWGTPHLEGWRYPPSARWGYPSVWTDTQTRVKTLPSPILRMRTVITW